jgi:hypothetical protein
MERRLWQREISGTSSALTCLNSDASVLFKLRPSSFLTPATVCCDEACSCAAICSWSCSSCTICCCRAATSAEDTPAAAAGGAAAGTAGAAAAGDAGRLATTLAIAAAAAASAAVRAAAASGALAVSGSALRAAGGSCSSDAVVPRDPEGAFSALCIRLNVGIGGSGAALLLSAVSAADSPMLPAPGDCCCCWEPAAAGAGVLGSTALAGEGLSAPDREPSSVGVGSCAGVG